jgi:hypothetical protein
MGKKFSFSFYRQDDQGLRSHRPLTWLGRILAAIAIFGLLFTCMRMGAGAGLRNLEIAVVVSRVRG